MNLEPSLKTTLEIDNTVHSLTSKIQDSVLTASNNPTPFLNNTKMPTNIKQLFAEKRRA